MKIEDMGIKELKYELFLLETTRNDPRVIAAVELIRKERKPQIDVINAKIKELQNKRPAKKPRWDENTPKEVLDICEKFWRGTTEFYTFRIHIWNNDFVWTSYPSGGYSDNGGWNPTPSAYHLISRKELSYNKPMQIKHITGRVSKDMMLKGLEEAPEILKLKLNNQ